ncbi:MAG TPA: 50S ribosomal protein L22 [Bacteroidales bacterium]|jgi:large subunit ribosomal protein L22|nr:50S ribosomal protein L22 [Bacteroidales bacterium]HPI85283.1 50S ribosomal protein L22 [Bacteroidales bacterium]
MGARKRLRAEKTKEAKKSLFQAKLNDCPTSPRKMRLVADMIRGENVELALHMLENSPQQAAGKMKKLLLSAIANWQQKNEGTKLEDSNLFVQTVMVDGGRMLKRVQPAPQGRAYRVRKRSNHVTLTLGSRLQEKES